MKKFRFRLERVLQHRVNVKREKQRDLIREQQILYEQQATLEALELELRQTGIAEGSIAHVHDIQLLGSYADRLRLRIEQQKVTIEESVVRVEEFRKIYQEAARDAEALEKLRIKKNDEYETIVAKEDEKFLDELTIMRAGVRGKDTE
jgi:flagellar export protein FliJ